MVSDQQYLDAVYDHADGRTRVEVKAEEIREQLGLTQDEDGREGHQIRRRLQGRGLVVLHQPLSSVVVLTEAGKADVEHRKG